MLPSLRSHKEYIRFVDKHMGSVQIPKAHDDVPDKLKLLDLTPIRLLFLPLYSSKVGRPSFAPEDMMRTFIVMVLCGVSSPTDWVHDYLKDKSGFYAVVSGFLPGEIPSVGCMYDFMSRILKIPEYYKNQYIRPKRKKLTKTQKKRLKDDKQKVTKRHVKIVARLADRFQRIDQNSQEVYIPHAEKIINDILELCCLNESQSRKLLDKQHLNISADGSKLKAYSKSNGKKVCDCESISCQCPRFFNSPDASWGYDAYRNCYVFGYNLYQVNSWSRQHKYELPVYLMMVTGSRHDSVPGMFAVNRTIKGMGYGVDNGCLDAAHDATDFYRLSRDMWNMRPFIPLNTTNEGNIKNLPMASITQEGIPVCQAEHQMYYSGYCKDRDRIKWRCPIKAVKKNQNLKCDFMDVCSPSEYGRVIYTHPKDNPRLYPPIPRTSQKWKDTYDHRTSAERVFKREKNDFKLTTFRTRSKKRLLFYSLLTAIAVHVDAWFHQDRQEKKQAA